MAIGTHLWQILGTLIAFHHLSNLTEALWPFQFAIGIPGSIQLLTHSFQTLVNKYLPGSPVPSTCSCALAIIDKVNMFNECSRLTCKHKLSLHHPDLVPIFDLLYYNDNVVWYQCPNGEWDSFCQQEGYTQGCPLSGMFASTVLHLALTDLCSSLDAHAMAWLALGNTGDDGFSSHSIIGNYHDDGGILIPNEDMQFAYKEFDHVGKPHSLCANWDKSGALVTLDPNIQPTSPAFLDGISIL